MKLAFAILLLCAALMVCVSTSCDCYKKCGNTWQQGWCKPTCGRRVPPPPGRRASLGGRIVGGSDAVKNSHPWLAALLEKGDFLCIANVICSNYLLTTAACVDNGDEYTLVFGEHTLSAPDAGEYSKTVSMANINIHGGYVFPNYDYALIKLDDHLDFDYRVQPVCLPPACPGGTLETECAADRPAEIAGWGRTTEQPPAPPSDVLQEAVVNIWNDSRCQQVYGAGNVMTNMCASAAGIGTCVGDSGGPLLGKNNGRFTACGIFNFLTNAGCGLESKGAGFSKTCMAIDWIKSNVDDACRKFIEG